MGLFAAAPEPCYFCGSAVGPSSRSNTPWTCPACGCWNGRDARGVIDGDHPAMRDSAMNGGSFAKRGRPSSSRLPPKPAQTPFCHTCQTNQTLVMNLLSTYLPDEGDESYAALAAELPAYRARLYARYPPVCARCQPGVDEALARADQRARAEAWGSALHRGASNGTLKPSGTAGASVRVGVLDVFVWRARGAAWGADVLAVVAAGMAAWLCPDALGVPRRHARALLATRATSLLWAVWDPTWLRRMRGRRSRVEGRGTWVALMLSLYVLRGAVALGIIYDVPCQWVAGACIADMMTVLCALTRLRVAAPIELRLVHPVPVSPPPEPVMRDQSGRISAELDAPLAAPHAPPTRASPVFGEASLSAPERGAEPMDWEPTSPSPSDWDAFGIGQQRMFASAESSETGLEALLAGWRIGGDTKTSNGGVVEHREANGMFALPSSSGKGVPAPPSGAPLLDGAGLRAVRGTLLAARVLAAVVMVARVSDDGTRAATATTLLALEGATSLLTLGVVLASPAHAASPPLALLLILDAAARFAALVAPAYVALAHVLAQNVSPEMACIAWAAADLALLAAT